MKTIVLMNPLAGSGLNDEMKQRIEKHFGEASFEDVTAIVDLKQFVEDLGEDADIVLAGGDGTLNRFVNAVNCDELKNRLYLFPSGSGNDFRHDVDRYQPKAPDPEKNAENLPILVNDYVKNLPTVTVNGKTYKFVNGVGYGIDGYCCEVGDALKAKGKKVNYTSIAIKGLLFHFKPRFAEVICDGKTYNFKKVWIAPTMNGSFYGGGMMPTPDQKRGSGSLSCCVMYGKGKLKTLMLFPKIFKGEHVKNKKAVQIISGKEICVRFSSPCALQIDGETILNVTEYTAKA